MHEDHGNVILTRHLENDNHQKAPQISSAIGYRTAPYKKNDKFINLKIISRPNFGIRSLQLTSTS